MSLFEFAIHLLRAHVQSASQILICAVEREGAHKKDRYFIYSAFSIGRNFAAI
jgi:hypothetical protein